MRAGRKGKAFLMSKHRTRTRRWSRLLSGVLCLALVLGLLPVTGVVQTAGAAHWADPYGEQLVEWGIIKSSPDLRLGDTITRAEFAAMCNRAFGFNRLGGTPFIDVPSSAWYAQDIDIAYNAGYFKGTSGSEASPLGSLTREQAAVLVARCMVMQESVGESLGFTDSRDLSDWSRGLVSTIADEGIVGGLPGGGFAPSNEITRGEVAAILVRAIGNPINKPGSYVMGEVYGNVTISSSNVTLRDTVILGDLYVTGGVDLGNVLLENVTVLGQIVISGGGVSDAARSSVILRNVAADKMVVDSIIDQFVTVSAYGITDIPNTCVRSSAYLEDSSNAGYGLLEIEQDGARLLQLAGSIKKVVNKTPNSTLQLVQGTAEVITVDEYATNSELLIDTNTRADVLNLDVATLVTGEGDIIQLNIGANGSEVDILPEHADIRPGLTATVNGEEIGSVAAAELSSEPRLMAGYPAVDSLRPTQAEGLYSGNKPGTIYWAVSELADGSVSVEDLIKNPAYGGNIFKDGAQNQSGDIGASAKVIYGRQITGLEPDGSYYISAILVDERGNRSPLKVISFRTPDDTVPALADDYPYMSKVTCDVAQVTAMANKNCTLYWVLLPAGAAAPTVQNFKSGSFGGTYGSGSMSVAKNVPVSVTVNSNRLQENTYYDLYLWLNDLDGTLSSEVIHVTHESAAGTKFSFRTPDETPPVAFDVTQTNFELPDAIEFTFRINEVPSTLYWAVVTETNDTFIASGADLNSSAIQIKVENGTKAGAIVSGSKAAAGASVDTLVEARDFANKLKYETYKTHNFKMYFVAKDAAGNYSEVDWILIHTRDAEPPTVTLDDTDTMDGKYPADSGLRLIFSEQVKGSTRLEDSTFVDLYNEVLANEDIGGGALTAAKSALADELARHIELWYKPRTVTEVVDSPLNDDKTDPHGWIDWREAAVTLESDGRVFLTLPAGKAVSLGSGMDYFFRFKNIYDHSYDHNLLVITDENGKVIDGGGTDDVCELPFTTLYATVWLSKDRTGVSNTNENNPENGTPLDIVFDVNPTSTSNMADTEFWDMVIWNANNIPCKFIVYRSVNGGDWERVTVNATIDTTDIIDTDPADAQTGEATIQGGNMTAVSLNHFKYSGYINDNRIEGVQDGQYETVQRGLVQGSTYKYAIHFTEVNGNTNRDAWTSLLKMEVRLVAGERGNLRTLADDIYNVDGAYKRLVNTEKVLNEISSVNLGTDVVNYLEVEKQFTDNTTPVFYGSYPTFTSTSSTITMSIALNRPGNVYYVVAPADGMIPTSIKDENGDVIEITYKNDGGEDDDPGKTPSETGLRTYIPESGSDLQSESLKGMIQFAATDEDGNARSDSERKYNSPAFGPVFAGSYSDPEGIIKKGSVEYTTNTRYPQITGLKQDTWYYVYMVLQSDSNKLDEVVQIYRVKTLEAQPPSITANRSGTSVDMKVYDAESGNTMLYDNPELYYALVRKDDLKPWIRVEKYVWNAALKADTQNANGPDTNNTSGAMTILEAMIRQVDSTGKSYFDTYANEALRNKVLALITRATEEDTKNDSIKLFGPQNINVWEHDCKSDMSMDGEYVMLICARHADKGVSDALAYGFAAAQGLYRPDDVPPEFLDPLGELDVSSMITLVYDQNGNSLGSADWGFGTKARNYGYNVKITITFSKPIYVYDAYDLKDNKLKQVVAKETGIDTDKEISFKNVFRGPDGILTGVSSNDNIAFTLTFTKVKNGHTFIMSDLYNSGGIVKSPKTLMIKFDTSLLTKEQDDEIILDKVAPRFLTTWG